MSWAGLQCEGGFTHSLVFSPLLQVSVRFMDHGNVEEREFSHLVSLKSEFRMLPFQVRQFLLSWCFYVLVSLVLVFLCPGVSIVQVFRCPGNSCPGVWCFLVFLCPGVLMSWCFYVLVFWCLCVLVFLCPGVLMSWCFYVLVFLCPGVLVFLCPGVFMSWCFYVLVFLCSGVSMS